MKYKTLTEYWCRAAVIPPMPLAASSLANMDPSTIFHMATTTVPGLNEHMMRMHERGLPPLEISVLVSLLAAVQSGQPVVLPPLPDVPPTGAAAEKQALALLENADGDQLILKVLSRTIYLGGLPDGTTREMVIGMLQQTTNETPTSVNIPQNLANSAFVKFRKHANAEVVVSTSKNNAFTIGEKQIKCAWRAGFGPKELCDVWSGTSRIPWSRLNEEEKKWTEVHKNLKAVETWIASRDELEIEEPDFMALRKNAQQNANHVPIPHQRPNYGQAPPFSIPYGQNHHPASTSHPPGPPPPPSAQPHGAMPGLPNRGQQGMSYGGSNYNQGGASAIPPHISSAHGSSFTPSPPGGGHDTPQYRSHLSH